MGNRIGMSILFRYPSAALARLAAERIHDVRHLESEALLPELCLNQIDRSSPYGLAVE